MERRSCTCGFPTALICGEEACCCCCCCCWCCCRRICRWAGVRVFPCGICIPAAEWRTGNSMKSCVKKGHTIAFRDVEHPGWCPPRAWYQPGSWSCCSTRLRPSSVYLKLGLSFHSSKCFASLIIHFPFSKIIVLLFMSIMCCWVVLLFTIGFKDTFDLLLVTCRSCCFHAELFVGSSL